MTKILVVAPSWVGDTVLAQSLFRQLHDLHPSLKLDVLAPKWPAEVLMHMPEVSAIVHSPFLHGELRLWARWRLAKQIKANGYEQAIVLPNSFKSALIPFFAGIPRRTGYIGEQRYGLLNDIRRLDKFRFPLMVERFVNLAFDKDFNSNIKINSPRLYVDPQKKQLTLTQLGLQTDKPIIAFCPGAEYGPAKRWPTEHFAQLADLVGTLGYEIWLIGSEKERPLGDSIRQQSGAGACINLCGKTTLEQAIHLLMHVQYVICNDSGLMHIAAALDKPLIALYGSSSPAFTPPLSSQAKILKLDLACSPCFERECPLHHFNCMKQLTPRLVFENMNLESATP